ncbi:MAG: chemotaxis response regulator protein-glutamate methylesterase [Ardenticatenales bacterium]|nr:chemotaxis response regulator protein-glutamate methylesterase [Ardenticatenales bacterium]
MSRIRVLVVDDSSFLRRYLPRLLERDPEIQVIGTASDGVECLQKIKELKPDVVTLDIVMPVMDGLEALKRLMANSPTPVVMLSSKTYEGAQHTLEALSLGAVDFVTKPSGPTSLDIDKVGLELIEKVKTAASSNLKNAMAALDVPRDKFHSIIETLTPTIPVSARPISPLRKRLVAIATSTGGPNALQAILPMLPETLKAAIVIVQHIAPGFTAPLVGRLNSMSEITVREAQDGLKLTPGMALLSPAELHLTIEREGHELVVRLKPEPSDTLHRPSADVLFRSIARCCAAESCAVILTGMGDDGAMGMRSIRDGGGYTIAQDEATSLVYGMPRQAVLAGGVVTSLPLDRIAMEIARITQS